MNILITGANGFLGQIISTKYDEYGTNCVKIGKGCDIDWDIRKPRNKEFQTRYDQVIHCAGKAHFIPKSKNDIDEIFQTNWIGTRNVLDSLKRRPPNRFLFISSVAVYGEPHMGDPLSEDSALLGDSPFAKSKIRAEQEVIAWGKKTKVPVLILRLPLVVAPNPPGNLGKMIRGIKTGRYLSLAKGRAKRSVVLADDVAQLIVNNQEASGVYNLTDGYHPSFFELEEVIALQLNRKLPVSISESFAKAIGRIGDFIPGSPVNSDIVGKMLSDYIFDDRKAREGLGWQPKKVIDHFRVR